MKTISLTPGSRLHAAAAYALPALVTLCLFLLPPLYFYLRFRAEMPFLFFAPDAFYYLDVARHSAHLGFFSNDGLHATNGFHPLWEWTESAATRLPFFSLARPEAVQRVLLLDLGIVGAALALLSALISRITGRFWLAVFAVCPGTFFLAFAAGAPQHFQPWAMVNGMETGVELLFFALAVHLLLRRFSSGGWQTYAGVLCLGLMVLSRLDDIFFLAAAFAVMLWPRGGRLRRAAAFALPAALIAGYMLYNRLTVGLWLPISGMAKAGLALSANISWIKILFSGRPFWLMDPALLAWKFSITDVQVLQMVAPAVIALVYLLGFARRTGDRPVLRALACGVVLKALYNLLMVHPGFQGHWYYGASVATGNILVAIMLDHMLRRPEVAVTSSPAAAALAHPLRFAAIFCGMALFACLCFNAAVAARTSGPVWQKDFALYQRGHEIAQHILAAENAAPRPPGVTGAPVFLEFDDGILSYASGLPSQSGLGLSTDLEAARAHKSDAYFELMARRGITVAGASSLYPLALSGNTDLLRYWGFTPAELKTVRFVPYWTDEASGVVLYRIEPTSAAAP